MSFSKLRIGLMHLWLRLNLAWADAAETQRRINEARIEQLRRYGDKWHR